MDPNRLKLQRDNLQVNLVALKMNSEGVSENKPSSKQRQVAFKTSIGKNKPLNKDKDIVNISKPSASDNGPKQIEFTKRDNLQVILVPLKMSSEGVSEDKLSSKQQQVAFKTSIGKNKPLNKDEDIVNISKLSDNGPNKIEVTKRDNLQVILVPLEMNSEGVSENKPGSKQEQVAFKKSIEKNKPLNKEDIVNISKPSDNGSKQIEVTKRDNLQVILVPLKMSSEGVSEDKLSSKQQQVAFKTSIGKNKPLNKDEDIVNVSKLSDNGPKQIEVTKRDNLQGILVPLEMNSEGVSENKPGSKQEQVAFKKSIEKNKPLNKDEDIVNISKPSDNGSKQIEVTKRDNLQVVLVPLKMNSEGVSENKPSSEQQQVAFKTSIEKNKPLNKDEDIVNISKPSEHRSKQIEVTKRDNLQVILVPLKMNEDVRSIPSSSQKYTGGLTRNLEPGREICLPRKIVTSQVLKNSEKTKTSKELLSISKNNKTKNLLLKQSAPIINKNENKSKNKQPKVTFQLPIERKNCKSSVAHNLRKLQPKNYLEESVVENSTALLEVSPSGDLAKKNLPVYKRTLIEEPKAQLKTDDLYEFTDFSPKAKKVTENHRQHRSSILFDKDTHEIMQKLEENEAKIKKKVARTRRKLEKEKYDKIVEKIVSKVKEKISKKNGCLKALVQPGLNQAKDVILVENKSEHLQKGNCGKITHISNFHEDLNIIVHSSSEVPSNIDKLVPVSVSIPESPITVTTRKRRISYCGESDNDIIDNYRDDFSDTSVRYPIQLQSIDSCDNSLIQNDNDNCFGFDDAPELNTPIKSVQENPMNIVCNVVSQSTVSNIESPQDFYLKRPNANSTMVCRPNISSPWRADSVRIKRNPHFLSLKSNALPRIDQEMILDHTLVENYESACKLSARHNDTPTKKQPVQQSILDYVHSTIEKEDPVRHGSLYDYEEFISPKKQVKTQDRDKVEGVKRNILGDEDCIVSSTPIRRRALTDISNFSEELRDPNSQNMTYFGFNESIRNSLNKTPEKHRKNGQNRAEDNKENDSAKPFRFDIDKLKNYSKKTRNIRKKATAEIQATVCDAQNKSISSFEVSGEEHSGDIHLFEEPEEMLDNMSPPHIDELLPRRERLNSCESDTSECGKKRKRHKKSKLELEQEAWIRDFNRMCDEVQNYELELE